MSSASRTVALCATVLLAPLGSAACGTSSSPPGPASARIYVSNQLDDTVSVIDGDTRKVVATVRVGVSPAEMAASPDGRSVYVADTGSDTVSVLDTATNAVARTIALPRGSRPIGVALSPGGRYLYTADGGADRVSVLDTQSGRVATSVRVGTQPLAVAVAPDGRTIYSADSGSGDISVIDARTNRVVRAIPAGRFPSGLAVTPDSASVYVTDELSGVTVINAATGTLAARLREPSPFSVAVGAHGARAYVTGLGPGEVTAIDTATHRVAATVSVGPYGTDPFTVRTVGHAVYVADQGANTVSVIDQRTFRTTATIRTGDSPYGIAIVPAHRAAGHGMRTRPAASRSVAALASNARRSSADMLGSRVRIAPVRPTTVGSAIVTP